MTTPPDKLTEMLGTEQVEELSGFGANENTTPPDPNIAVGPSQIAEATNSSVYVFSHTAVQGEGQEFGFDLNTFINGGLAGVYIVSNPRIIYDAPSGRYFLSALDTNRFHSGVCGNYPTFEYIFVSPSSTLSTTDSWYGFGWSPFKTVTDGLTGAQPALGISTNLVTSSQNALDTCTGAFSESESLVVQKSDLLDGTVTFNGDSAVDITDGPRSPQPVQELSANQYQYIVWNNSDASEGGCTPTCSIGVTAIHGTPRAHNVVVSAPVFEPMTPTAVQCSSTCSNPPADQLGTAGQLLTGDDHFLSAVSNGNAIWTSDGTTCTPSGDTAPRSCLDFVSVGADAGGNVTSGTQINNVGVAGASLAFPAVSLDTSGDVIAVFDEASSTTYASIQVAAIQGGNSLSTFTTVRTSGVYYGPCGPVGAPIPCAWGSISGAAVDPNNPTDVWVVSEVNDGDITPLCSNNAHLCWDTWIARYTLAAPAISGVTPTSGPVAGGQTVTVSGADFGMDATATLNGASIIPRTLQPGSFTFVTPAFATSGGAVQIQLTDALGTSVETAASAYAYVGLANYVPLSSFRILDTRPNSGSTWSQNGEGAAGHGRRFNSNSQHCHCCGAQLYGGQRFRGQPPDGLPLWHRPADDLQSQFWGPHSYR